MKRQSLWKYFAVGVLVSLFGGRVTAQDVQPNKVSLSLEGGYGMMNSSLRPSPTFWGSAGLGLGLHSVIGLEGGYLKTKKDQHTYGSYSYFDSRRSAYVGPFAERFWNHDGFGFSLRAGAGAWYEESEYSANYKGVTGFSTSDVGLYPALTFAGMAYVRLTQSLNLGAGLREVLIFGSGDDEIFWNTVLMPFMRLSVSF